MANTEAWRGLLAKMPMPRPFDELWLRTENILFSRERHRVAAEENAALAESLRREGTGVVLEVGELLGHYEIRADLMDVTFPDDALMVGRNGIRVPGVYCPSYPPLVDELISRLELYCNKTHYDALVFDDDLRFRDHGAIVQGCNCRRCLEAFSAMTGREWTREALAATLVMPCEQEVRIQWSMFHQRVITDFLCRVGQWLQRVSPGTELGLNDISGTEAFYEFNDVRDVCRDVNKATGCPMRMRIGGDRWEEARGNELGIQALMVGSDAQDMKECGETAGMRVAEVANQAMTATTRSTESMLLDGAIQMARGCNAVAFMATHFPLMDDEWMKRFLNRLEEYRPLYVRLAELADTGGVGGLTLSRTEGFKRQPGKYNPYWFVWQPEDARALIFLGLPVQMRIAAHDATANPVLLTGESAKGISEEEFKAFYRRGLLVSGNAFIELQKRYLVDFTKVQGAAVSALSTRLVNRTSAGDYEGGRLAVAHSDVIGFAVQSESRAEILAEYDFIERTDKRHTAAIWRYEDENGRLAVVGAPGDFWNHYNLPHLELLRDLADWVGAAPMPVRLKETAMVTLVPNVAGDGSFRAVSILNMSCERYENLAIAVRHPVARRFLWLLPGQPPMSLPAEINGDEAVVHIPLLTAMQFGLLACE